VQLPYAACMARYQKLTVTWQEKKSMQGRMPHARGYCFNATLSTVRPHTLLTSYWLNRKFRESLLNRVLGRASRSFICSQPVK
jgi:hypothetical protein